MVPHISHQHGNQMNGLNLIRIEQLFPTARILQPNRHPEIEHSPSRAAQLPQVLLDFGFLAHTCFVHLQIFDLPGDSSVVEHDQQIAQFFPIRLLRVRIAPVGQKGFRREAVDYGFGSLSFFAEIVSGADMPLPPRRSLLGFNSTQSRWEFSPTPNRAGSCLAAR